MAELVQMQFYYLKWGPPALKNCPFESLERQHSRMRSRLGLRCHFDREIGVRDDENGKGF